MGALDGVRVLDLSRVLAGPYCTMLLGDLGADVIKVENPDGGDDTRQWGPPFVAGESAYFLGVNRNKRSVTINLKDPMGQELIRKLARRCDVFIENMRPGTLDRLTLDPPTLRALNPCLVTCSLSAFGPNGPYRDDPGYDFTLQALGGLMSITGQSDGEPTKVGVALIDVLTGLFATNAILAALRVRDATGEGQHVDVSLLEAEIAALANVASGHLVSGARPRRYGNAHPSIVPYQVFEARDRPFALAVGNDRQFAQLCGLLGHPEWSDDARFASNPDRVANREVLIALLSAQFSTRDAAEWVSSLRAAGLPCALINHVDEVFAHEQVQALGVVERIAHPTAGAIPLVRSPFHLSATPPTIRRPPPRLGEHTQDVLSELLGLGGADVERLRQSGVVSTL
ncbi:MAG TPA: CoA transferase [Chloroflexota bacterium]|nr:CoA transferase [Chloroflexota bacterium]